MPAEIYCSLPLELLCVQPVASAYKPAGEITHGSCSGLSCLCDLVWAEKCANHEMYANQCSVEDDCWATELQMLFADDTNKALPQWVAPHWINPFYQASCFVFCFHYCPYSISIIFGRVLVWPVGSTGFVGTITAAGCMQLFCFPLFERVRFRW